MEPPAKKWRFDQIVTHPRYAYGPLGTAWRFMSHRVWLVDVDRLPTWKRWLYRAARIVFLTLRSFHGDRCMIQAAALTYVTVLSLVPMLAFAFAMLKGMGFYEELRTQRIEPFLDQMTHGAVELRQGLGQVLDLVDKTDLKTLGSIGLIVLLIAVIRLLGSIEQSFNEIWGVHKARSWVRKLADYLTMVVITPMFLVVAIGVTSAAESRGVVDFARERLALGWVIEAWIKSLPMIGGCVAFTLVYLVMPNRRTKLRSAMLGGLLAGVLWQLALIVQIKLQVGIAKINPIYASFAAIPVFLVWVQTSWVIVLLGAEFAFAHESEPAYRGIAGYEQHHHAFKEQIALRALTRISSAFLNGEPPRTAATIAAELGISPREVREILDELQHGNLVASFDPGPGGAGGFLPARDPSIITVVDVLDTLRGKGLDGEVVAQNELDRHVDRLLKQLDSDARSSAYNRTLRDLVEEAQRRERAAEATVATETSVQPS